MNYGVEIKKFLGILNQCPKWQRAVIIAHINNLVSKMMNQVVNPY